METEKKEEDWQQKAIEGKRYERKVFLIIFLFVIIIIAGIIFLSYKAEDYLGQLEVHMNYSYGDTEKHESENSMRYSTSEDNPTQTNTGPRYVTEPDNYIQGVMTYGDTFTFDGNSHVYLGDDLLDQRRSGSVIAWVKRNYGNEPMTIVSSASGQEINSLFTIRLYNKGDDDYRLSVGSRNIHNWIYGNKQIDTGWHQIAVTSNGQFWELYVDGEKDQVNILTGVNSGEWWMSADSGINRYAIGTLMRKMGNQQNFIGTIKLVRLYDYTINEEYVKNSYGIEKIHFENI